MKFEYFTRDSGKMSEVNMERREFDENLAILIPDLNYWFHAINTMIDTISWVITNLYLAQCMYIYISLTFIQIQEHCAVSDKTKF